MVIVFLITDLHLMCPCLACVRVCVYLCLYVLDTPLRHSNDGTAASSPEYGSAWRDGHHHTLQTHRGVNAVVSLAHSLASRVTHLDVWHCGRTVGLSYSSEGGELSQETLTLRVTNIYHTIAYKDKVSYTYGGQLIMGTLS